MRLQQYLAHAGVASRRKCEEYILDGRVSVNGNTVTVLGTKVDPDCDEIRFDGQTISFEKKKVYCFYKPPHVVCSSDDPEGRQTVQHYFGDLKERIYNVGRLDYDSEGVLVMTNDGDLANALTHPSNMVYKTYFVVCSGMISPEEAEHLRRGVDIDGKTTSRADVRVLRVSEEGSNLLISIHEGRNRQIRKMLDAIDHPVRFLRRDKFANLTLEGLKPGQYRLVEGEELIKLRQCAGLAAK